MRSGGEVGEDTVAHLGGGFVGKGDGEDLFGLLDGGVGEQLEQTLDEQAGLARAGWGLDDEGAVDVERLTAGFGVGRLSGAAGGEAEGLSHGRPPGLRNRRRRTSRADLEIFIERVGVECGGIEAAEQALIAVAASLRVLLRDRRWPAQCKSPRPARLAPRAIR